MYFEGGRFGAGGEPGMASGLQRGMGYGSQPSPGGYGSGAPAVAVPFERGCLTQAVADITGYPGTALRILRAAAVPAAIAVAAAVLRLVPIAGAVLCPIGMVCTALAYVCCVGFAVGWGREPARRASFDTGAPVLRTSLLSLGFTCGAVAVLFTAVAYAPTLFIWLMDRFGYLFGLGFNTGGTLAGTILAMLAAGVIGFVFRAVTFALSVVLGAVGCAVAMHLAVDGHLESAFSIKDIWRALRAQPVKMLLAGAVPGLVADVVISVASNMLSFISGGLSLSPLGLPFAGLALGASALSGGVIDALVNALEVAIWFFVNGVACIVSYRAMGYWAARFAPDWARGSADDCFVAVPGDRGFTFQM